MHAPTYPPTYLHTYLPTFPQKWGDEGWLIWQNLLKSSGAHEEEWVVYRTAEVGELPRLEDDLDGVLIPGSHYSAYEEHAWIHALCDYVRQCYIPWTADTNDPEHVLKPQIVGSCFGAQIVARALGGTVAPNPRNKCACPHMRLPAQCAAAVSQPQPVEAIGYRRPNDIVALLRGHQQSFSASAPLTDSHFLRLAACAADIVKAEEVLILESFVRQPFAEGLFMRTSAGPRFQPEPRKWKEGAGGRKRKLTINEERETIPFMRITQTHGACMVWRGGGRGKEGGREG